MTHNDYKTFQRKLGVIIELAYEEGARIEEEETTNKGIEFKLLHAWLRSKQVELRKWLAEHDAELSVFKEMKEDFKKVFETIDLSLKEN